MQYQDTMDTFFDVELVWHNKWVRWYVDGVMLHENYLVDTWQQNPRKDVVIQLSVKTKIALEQITLSSANAFDLDCAPEYHTFSPCRPQESWKPRVGSIRGSFSNEEVDMFLQEIVATYPQITKLEELGHSVEGRIIHALCMGACTPPDNRTIPQVLYTGLHHAREPLSMMTLIYTIDILTTDYQNGNFAALELLSSRQLWFIPIVNPDGYAHNVMARVWEQNQVGQRKSGASTCTSSPPDAGVDLNRNYDVCFARDQNGSSNNPCGDDYNGVKAFSEPETQAVRNLVERRTSDFRVALNYHSYGMYFNIPFACQEKGVPRAPFHAIFMALAREMTRFNKFDYGQSWQSSDLYTVNGETSDWMWQTHGIFALSPEVGPKFDVMPVLGFWPLPDDVPYLSSELHYSNLYAARIAGPMYTVDVKSVKLTTMDATGSTVSVVAVHVLISNQGFRPETAEILGSFFLNGTNASKSVHLHLPSNVPSSGILDMESLTLRIPYSQKIAINDMTELYLIIRDALSCHLVRVAVHFSITQDKTFHTSFQTWKALPLPRCGTCSNFGANNDTPTSQEASLLCSALDDVAVLKPIETRPFTSIVFTENNFTTQRLQEWKSKASSLPSLMPWSASVAVVLILALILLAMCAVFFQQRRRPCSKRTNVNSSSKGSMRRQHAQYSRIQTDVPMSIEAEQTDDNIGDETSGFEAEFGER
ncbi:hypothetical protein CCR75_007132 [Bremia lactucae]|uniref:Peptidase M14 domain-containing protein n=1 Tax=Bremia lactucae TaxID=4779 RepID=A0A976FGD8_BRELC|nr:hypothetical protein CCR75_007132 [Bremia lactucae]